MSGYSLQLANHAKSWYVQGVERNPSTTTSMKWNPGMPVEQMVTTSKENRKKPCAQKAAFL